MSDGLAAFYAARLDEDATLAAVAAKYDARFDPARVLREVEAGRAILARYAEVQSWPYPPADGDDAIRDELDLILRIKAAVHDSHPDYDEAWKP